MNASDHARGSPNPPIVRQVATALGDVETSRRAVVRCIDVSDQAGAIAFAMQARLSLADLELAAGAARRAA